MDVFALRFLKPLPVIVAGALLLLAFIVGGNLLLLGNLRGSTLRNAEETLSRHSLTLAEQADRSFKSLDLVLSSVEEYVERMAPVARLQSDTIITSYETHLFLKEKLTGLPQVEAITIINAEGKLLNFSRYYPIPEVNVSDRDYFKALVADETLNTFFSVPVQNRGSGTWNIYMARRLSGPNGEFKGLVLGAMALKYFEDFYRATSLGEGSAVSLVRTDGTLLVRHPQTSDIGRVFETSKTIAVAPTRTVRQASPIDGEIRIKSASFLANYPMMVLATQTEASVLRPWWEISRIVILVSTAAALAIMFAASVIGRWWRQQSDIARANADQANAERARALAEAELLRAREREAEAASKAKSSFLAVMSHEIRTPMNAVLGLATTLLNSDLTEEDRETVRQIHDAGDNLLEILNDILDYSKLEAGQLSFEEIAFAPSSVIESALGILGPRANAKGVALRQEVAADLPPAVLGDAGRLRQVLLNIVSNAVKFTEKGSVTVAVRNLGRSDGRARLEWIVRDTGIGIPPERVGLLFQDFVQADCTINRRFGGSGLGLAICKRILDQMQGEIAVESQVGHGTTVRIRVALEETAAPAHTDLPAQAEDATLRALVERLGRPLRVLVVDDNPTNRLVAARMLRDVSAQVDTANDGAEAVAAAMRFPYDVILMDMRMPEMDGLTAARTIRARSGPNEAAPIIAFTANAFPDDVKACLDAGMNDFVAKPVRKRVLIGAIARALDDTSAASTGAGAEDAPASATKPAFDIAVFEELRAEIGAEALAEGLQVFGSETRERIASIARLASALDAECLAREAHSLKGMAGTFGFSRLAERASTLEKAAPSAKAAAIAAAAAELAAAFEAGWICIPPITAQAA